jgi:hypothetical protein
MTRLSRRGPLLVGAVLAVLVASPVAADTTGGPTDVEYAYASSPDGNSDVQVSHDNLAGRYGLWANTTSFEPITCEDGREDYITTGVNGYGVPTTVSFGKALSSASATGTIPATRSVYNGCTGDSTQVSVSMTVTISLVGSRYTSTTTSRTVTKNPDGTTTTSTGKNTQTIASGSFSIDGVSSVATNAYVAHDVMAVKTK